MTRVIPPYSTTSTQQELEFNKDHKTNIVKDEYAIASSERPMAEIETFRCKHYVKNEANLIESCMLLHNFNISHKLNASPNEYR